MTAETGSSNHPSHAGARRAGVAAVVLGWLAVAALFVVHFGYYVPPSNDDDPYITYRYAWNLLHGHGLSWNPGEPFQGYSNLLWVLLNALLQPLVGDFLTASRLVSCASFATILAVGVVSLRAVAPGVSGRLWGLAFGLLVVCCAPLMRYAVYGWEMAVFPALLMAALHAFVRETEGRSRGWWSVPLALLAVLSRSEGPAHLLAFGVVRLLLWRGGARPCRRDAVWWGSVVAMLACYLVFQWLYFGTLLTGPYIAKIAGHTEFAFGREYMMGILVYAGAAPALLFAAGALLCARFAPVRAAMWFVPCLVQTAVILRANGDFWPGFRLFAGLYPLLYLGALTGFAAAAPRVRPVMPRRAIVAAGLLLAVATACCELNTDRVSVARFLREGPLSEKWRTARELRVPKSGLWSDPVRRIFAPPSGPFTQAVALVLDHTLPGEEIVFPDIGFIGLATGRVLHDQRGLVDRDAALSIYHERRGDAALCDEHAARFIDKVSSAPVTFVGVARHATRINELVGSSAWLRDGFTEVGATPDHTFFVRNDRIANPLDAATKEANWRSAHEILPRYPFFTRRLKDVR